MRIRRIVAASLLALGCTVSLAACGGGGDGKPAKVTTGSEMMSEQQMDKLQQMIEKSAAEGSLSSVVTTTAG